MLISILTHFCCCWCFVRNVNRCGFLFAYSLLLIWSVGYTYWMVLESSDNNWNEYDSSVYVLNRWYCIYSWLKCMNAHSGSLKYIGIDLSTAQLFQHFKIHFATHLSSEHLLFFFSSLHRKFCLSIGHVHKMKWTEAKTKKKKKWLNRATSLRGIILVWPLFVEEFKRSWMQNFSKTGENETQKMFCFCSQS